MLDLMAPDEKSKDLWVRSLTKLFHEQEIALMMDPGALGDDETMREATLTAKEQKRRKKAAIASGSTPEKQAVDLSGKKGNLFNAALDKLKPKELSLAIGGEYRVIKPLDGHEAMALKDGQTVLQSLVSAHAILSTT